MINKGIKSPVLLLAFNRPEKTKEVFECIRRARPRKFYAAIDAPREGRPDDVENCNRVKEIVKNVDWPCETHYLFHETNQGCAMAGKKAWDWIFETEDDMIFMEDDGVVSDSFFQYCQECLDKYRHDERIAYIGGVNFGLKYGDASYFFTRYSVSTYGMATWKRVYELYEFKLESYPDTRNTKEFRSQFLNRFERDRTYSFFDKYWQDMQNGVVRTTYDLQMSYLVRKYHMWCIYPNVNLVTNIGFDIDGTNTAVDPNSKTAQAHIRPRYELETIKHPTEVEIDMGFERKMFRQRSLNNNSYLKSMLIFYLHFFYKKLHHSKK